MPISFFFFFNDTATTEIYTLSLHDALPISRRPAPPGAWPLLQPLLLPQTWPWRPQPLSLLRYALDPAAVRSEEHTSELQSPCNLVCRLLLEKKKQMTDLRSDSGTRLHMLGL